MAPGRLKNGPQAIGKSRAADGTPRVIWLPNGHNLCPLAGNAHHAPEGRALLAELGPMPEKLYLLMDRAYEGDKTRQLVLDLGMVPVVPPKSNRLRHSSDRAFFDENTRRLGPFIRLKPYREIQKPPIPETEITFSL